MKRVLRVSFAMHLNMKQALIMRVSQYVGCPFLTDIAFKNKITLNPARPTVLRFALKTGKLTLQKIAKSLNGHKTATE